MRVNEIGIVVGEATLAGSIATPDAGLPGILFLHGWGGSQQRDLERARKIAALGCVCLTFDFRGHAATEAQRGIITRQDSLHDALAAYDTLVAHKAVDKSCIAVVGSSYGGYLAAILSTLRPVKWMALRVPALYRDSDWEVPKQTLSRNDISTYRSSVTLGEDNRALAACRAFKGDVLVVESEQDHLVPHPVIASYLAAFTSSHSLTYRVVAGADHALSTEDNRKAYDAQLIGWIEEMVLGAR